MQVQPSTYSFADLCCHVLQCPAQSPTLGWRTVHLQHMYALCPVLPPLLFPCGEPGPMRGRLCAGGGVTQLAMPALTSDIHKHMSGLLAWRWAFFLPAGLQVAMAMAILIFGQVPTHG